MLVRIVVMISLLLSGSVMASPLPPVDPTAEAAAIRWLGSSAHKFTSECPSDDQLQPIVGALAGAQVIGIGEATHGMHEDQAFKAELIKALVRSRRVEVLVLELNRQVGFYLDAYVMGRGGDLPVFMRSPSFFRIWRDDEFTGLLLWLRAFNLQTDHPIRILSVDVQDAGADADLALRFVADRDPGTASRLRKAFPGLLPGPGSERFSPWQAKIEKAVYARATQAAQDLSTLLSSRRADWSAVRTTPRPLMLRRLRSRVSLCSPLKVAEETRTRLGRHTPTGAISLWRRTCFKGLTVELPFSGHTTCM